MWTFLGFSRYSFWNFFYAIVTWKTSYLDLLTSPFAIENDGLHHAEVSAKKLHPSIELLQVHWSPPVAIISLHVAQTCAFAFFLHYLFANLNLLNVNHTLLLRLNYCTPIHNHHDGTGYFLRDGTQRGILHWDDLFNISFQL